MVAPTAAPRFSNTSTYATSSRASSAAVRSAQRSTTARTPATPSVASDPSCSRRVEHDLGGAARRCGREQRRRLRRSCERDRRSRDERRPPVGERAHRVRVGRLDPADAERAAGRGEVGSALTCPDDRDPLAGEGVVAQLVRRRAVGGIRRWCVGHRGHRSCGSTSVAKRSRPSTVERRAQGEDHPVGAGVAVVADAVDDLLRAALEHARRDEIGHAAELRLEVARPHRDADVDRLLDRRRVAPDGLAVRRRARRPCARRCRAR